jgi:hypothetical protein
MKATVKTTKHSVASTVHSSDPRPRTAIWYQAIQTTSV